MRITSTAPCRVDLAGGTLDIWPLYLFHTGAVTVNFAVTAYTSCTIDTRKDSRIVLRSRDLRTNESFESLNALRLARRYRVALPAYLLRFFQPGTGLDLETHSEAPAGAGISGSSALMISVASALSRLTSSGYAIEKLREIVQNIEAQIIRVPTGAQDYYPAMYGGVSAIELSAGGVKRSPIAVDHDELTARMVLAYTGVPRNSGINNWEVTKAHIDGNRRVHRNFDTIAAIAQAMRTALSQGNWTETGRLLREEWSHRRKNAPGISTDLIDHLVKVTRPAGALGAKVCGAGGGGCVFFLADRDARDRVANVIRRAGAEVLDVGVAPRGVKLRVQP